MIKYFVVLSFAVPVLGSCGTHESSVRLLTKQKQLKDSANRINDKIGYYLQKGFPDSAALQKQHLGALHQKLVDIQSELDSRKKK